MVAFPLANINTICWICWSPRRRNTTQKRSQEEEDRYWPRSFTSLAFKLKSVKYYAHRLLSNLTTESKTSEPATPHPGQQALLAPPLRLQLVNLRSPLLHQWLHQLPEGVAQALRWHLWRRVRAVSWAFHIQHGCCCIRGVLVGEEVECLAGVGVSLDVWSVAAGVELDVGTGGNCCLAKVRRLWPKTQRRHAADAHLQEHQLHCMFSAYPKTKGVDQVWVWSWRYMLTNTKLHHGKKT